MKNKNTRYTLNDLVSTYNIDNIYEQYKRFEFLDKLSPYINLKKSTVLEFGSATGQMTKILSKRSKSVMAVDGSAKFIKIAKARVKNAKNVNFCESYFEDFKIDKKYDCLIMHHILEHIEDPKCLLSKIKTLLNDGGIFAISVPNSHALSRQLAVKMKILSSIYDLTDNDKKHGHYQVYDWKVLEKEVIESGLNIIGKHGLSFKLFSDKQNIKMFDTKIITEKQIKGLWQLGDEMKEVAGAIMIVAQKKQSTKKISFTEKNIKRNKLIDILPAKLPLGLCIEPTNKCNFRCIQCPVSSDEFSKIVGKRKQMSMRLYKKIIGDIKKMGRLNNLNLYGDGEPLLHPNIIEMIKIAKKSNIANAITVTTNASLLTNDLSNDLIDSGLDYLRVSVYSIYDDRFKKITRTEYKSDLIYNNVARLFKNRAIKNKTTPFIYVKIIDTYNKENKEFISKYSSISDEVNIETPMNWNGYKDIDLIGNIDEKHKTDTKTLQGYYGKRNVSNNKKICTTPFLSLNIKSNGDVCICIVDWNKGTKVGNIMKSSLSEIWYGENLREFRRMHIEGRRHENKSCKNCDFMYCNPDNMDGFSSQKYNDILNYKGEL